MELPSATQPTFYNHNPAFNHLIGSGTIINNNRVTNKVVYGDPPRGSDKIQQCITTALRERHVPQAVYSAQLSSGCMPGTRVQILRDIESWIKDPKAPQIFWLAGLAGVGKSAIAWAICALVHAAPEIVLGGSFFCSRSTGTSAQRDVRCIIPTLAQLLARQSPPFGEALAAELAADPDVVHHQVTAQVERLLYKPLLALKDSPMPIVLVIDALDECCGQLTANGPSNDAESHRIVSDLLEALVAFARSSSDLPVKFLVTSRPEAHIRDTSVSDATLNKVLRLHTVDKQQVTADIRLYISSKLLGTPKLRTLFVDKDVELLVQLCDGLFIVATTALNYTLYEGVDAAGERFNILLNASRNGLTTGAAAPLDLMYEAIVEDAARAKRDGTDRLKTLLQTLASLISARMTLSVAALADLLSIERIQLRARLSRLHAVVHIPDEDDEANLRTLHASFGDYLLSRAPIHIRISSSLGDKTLAYGCLHVMEKCLHFNVSQSRSSYERSSKPDSITLSLEYSCLQWIYHVSFLFGTSVSGGVVSEGSPKHFLSEQLSELEQKISVIFCPRLLFWLEVMSVLELVRRAAAMLNFGAVSVQSRELSVFLHDANSFVASSYEAIEWSAPHIYLSALPFSAKKSLVHKIFYPQVTGMLDVDMHGVDHHGGQQVMRLTGHEDCVRSVAYSPDGTILVSGSDDGTVRIWDTRSGEEMVPPLRSYCGIVTSVSFAHSGEEIASGTGSGVVCVWSLQAGQATFRQQLRGHSAAVISIAYSPTRPLLVSSSKDRSVRLWSPITGQQIRLLEGNNSAVKSVAFSPDGNFLASGSSDGDIRLCHGATGDPIYQPYHQEHSFLNMCFFPDGRTLAVASYDGFRVCDAQDGKSIARLHDSLFCRSIQCSPDGRLLVTANDLDVRLWTYEPDITNTLSISLYGHKDTVNYATFSPNGLYIASASDDRTIRIWGAGSERQPSIQLLSAHEDRVQSVAVSPNQSFIVSGSSDMSVRVWDALTGKPKFPALTGHTRAVWSVAVSPDERWIASGSLDHTVRLWDARTGKPVGTPIQNDSARVYAVAFSPDSRLLVSGSSDRAVRIWDISTRSSLDVGPLLCHDQVWSVAFSPDGGLIAAGAETGRIYLWYSRTGIRAFESPEVSRLMILSIAFSPDGTRLASGGTRESVCIWNVSTGQQLFSLESSSWYAQSLMYSPDGHYICSGSEDCTVRLWNAVTGTLMATLHGHTSKVRSVSFASHGGSIVSGSYDHTIRVWDISAALPVSSTNDDPATALVGPTLENGWLTSSSGERLMWVPTEYHKHLQPPPCVLSIRETKVIIAIGSSGWHRGENWTACWLKK